MTRYVCIYVVLLWLVIDPARAQYLKVEMGLDGFTCSLCGNSVENSLRRLPFVEKIQMDLNNNTVIVFFRKQKEVSIQQLSDKVYDAGFSVRYMLAEYDFPELKLENHFSYSAGKESFHFLGVDETSVKGVTTIIFLNKRLISRKEYTHWEEWIRKDMKKNGKRENVYYVTLHRG